MELHRSARKHGVADDDIAHAAAHAVAGYALEDFLELVVLKLDDGRRLVIHAMPMRSVYRDLLPDPMKPDTPPTSNDVPITDEVIDSLVDEAKSGYDVGKLRGRGRPRLGDGPSEVVPVRLDPQLRRALEERAADEHTTQSDLIRRALRTFLKVG